MKRTLYIGILIIISAFKGVAQEAKNNNTEINTDKLVGTWQCSEKDSDEKFQFLTNNKFIYLFPSDVNRKFIKMTGIYKIIKEELHLKMISYVEIIGGEIVTGGYGASIDLFEVYKGVPKEVVLKKGIELDPLFLSKFDFKKGSVTINSKTFSRISK